MIPSTYVNCSSVYILLGIVAASIFCQINLVLKVETILDLEVSKCPFCYGKSLCNDTKDIYINISLISYLLNTKNVYYGIYNNFPVVIKKLVTTYELNNFDNEILEKFGPVRKELFKGNNVSFYNEILTFLNVSFSSLIKLKICPSIKNIDVVLELFLEYLNDNDISFREKPEECLAVIFSLMKINPEPILLQVRFVFNVTSGWPVPRYYGSCGRIAVSHFCGEMLSTYNAAPWLLRIHFAQQLLEIAHNFTFNHPTFALYFTDFTADNTVVAPDLNLRVVDFENVILLDKHPPYKDVPLTWFSQHSSEHFECEGCLAYSANEICHHHVSDHNFYAVCKEFLDTKASQFPNGLLHDPPKHISETYPLQYLVNQCIQPTEKNFTRYEIVAQLFHVIEEIKAEGSFNIIDYNL